MACAGRSTSVNSLRQRCTEDTDCSSASCIDGLCAAEGGDACANDTDCNSSDSSLSCNGGSSSFDSLSGTVATGICCVASGFNATSADLCCSGHYSNSDERTCAATGGGRGTEGARCKTKDPCDSGLVCIEEDELEDADGDEDLFDDDFRGFKDNLCVSCGGRDEPCCPEEDSSQSISFGLAEEDEDEIDTRCDGANLKCQEAPENSTYPYASAYSYCIEQAPEEGEFPEDDTLPEEEDDTTSLFD